MYKETMNEDGKIIRRHYNSAKTAGKKKVDTAFEQSDALLEAKKELSELIGAKAFYRWSCLLDPDTIMSNKEYRLAIESFIEPIEAETEEDKADWDMTTQELRHG